MNYKKSSLSPQHLKVLEQPSQVDHSTYFEMLVDGLVAELDKELFEFVLRIYYNNIKYTDELKLSDFPDQKPPKYYFVILNRIEMTLKAYREGAAFSCYRILAGDLKIVFSNFTERSEVKLGTGQLLVEGQDGLPFMATRGPNSLVMNLRSQAEHPTTIEVQIQDTHFNV
jgi:hypothetical protein